MESKAFHAKLAKNRKGTTQRRPNAFFLAASLCDSLRTLRETLPFSAI
jgi:hypothetical protein